MTLLRSAALVHFTVEPADALIRVRREGRSIVIPAAADNAIMIGPGGASSVSVFTPAGDAVVVRVTRLVDCEAAEPGTCVPPVMNAADSGDGTSSDAAIEGAAVEDAPAATP